MIMNRIYISAIAVLLALVSCEKAREDHPLVKLGAATKEYVVEVDGGIVDIPVYSNGSYHIDVLSDNAGWLKLTMPSKLEENGYIRAECDFNESFRRQVVFTLNSDVDSRVDTVLFRQKGLKSAMIAIDNMSLQAKGAGGEESFDIQTNIPSEEIVKTIRYSSEGDSWLHALTIGGEGDSGRTVSFSTDPNPSEDVPRMARVNLAFTDGWGESVSLSFNVIQRTSTEEVGREVSMSTLKYETVQSGKMLGEFVIVDGIVVSNKENRNAGDNEQLTPSTIDYSLDQRTIYLESPDGKEGICLIAETPDDNITKPYQRVQVLLYGTMPKLYEDPSYLVVSGITAEMFVSQKDGESFDVPAKAKYIRELTEDDIFTYVTLKDVEFPVRKGDLVPVNEGYTIATGAHRLAKYPRLVRDINGDDIYLYTNTVCSFRNSGDILPYGSGTLSGVLVHERFPRFEWENLADPQDIDDGPMLGRIGAFQLRPQTRADVWDGMQADVENSFSKILTEYRFWNPDESAGVLRPTYGTNGWFTHTCKTKYTGSASKTFILPESLALSGFETFSQPMFSSTTWDYLGPIGKGGKHIFGNNLGNTNAKGIGVVLDPSKEHWNRRMDALVDQVTDPAHPIWCGPAASSEYVNFVEGTFGSINYTNAANQGKGFVPDVCYTAFQTNYWWDYESGRPYSWLLNFSTAGIAATQLSLQVSVLNTSQQYYSPRYWRLEWSTTDDQNDANWTLIKEYTVPDVAVWSSAQYYSIPAFKQINFALPLELLGKDNVYLRMRPANDICSSGADYADGHMIDATTPDCHYSTISYIAIRYN